ATSAVRDAENGEAFLGEIEWSYGFATRVVTGDEEAQLTRRGVGEREPETLVLDIGGGSTELVVDEFHVSLPMGSVRFTEREPERAPVIVAGAVILVETLDFFGLGAIEVSERDILDGIALAAAELPGPAEGAAPPGAYTCC